MEMTCGTLLTTGLAERGWDIPGVHWIIQYDPPHKPEVCFTFKYMNMKFRVKELLHYHIFPSVLSQSHQTLEYIS